LAPPTSRACEIFSFRADGQPGFERELVEGFALARKHDPALEAGLFLGTPAVAAWAVRKGDVALLAALDEHTDAVRQSPVRSALAVKDFDEGALGLLRRARKETVDEVRQDLERASAPAAPRVCSIRLPFLGELWHFLQPGLLR